MEFDTALHLALFSGILGFVVFCASYAFHVWRGRNTASVNGRPYQRTAADRIRHWSAGLTLVGLVALIAAMVWREARPREGILSGDGLFTIRADANLKLEHVTTTRTAKTGDVLARFRSPERQAEITELRLRQQILEARRAVLQRQPLEPDAELVRHYQNADSDRRQMEGSIHQLIPEHALVERERLCNRLDKTERIHALQTRLEQTREELAQARARLGQARRYLKRAEDLSSNAAAAPLERDDRATEAAVLETEVAKLDDTIQNLMKEKKYLEGGLPEYQACASRQSDLLSGELQQARQELARTREERALYADQLAGDRQRAEELRARQLDQIDLEIQQCQAHLAGLQDVLTIRSPFNGTVAYADPAPQTALPLAPVVVLTPEHGFRFRLRLPVREITALAEAGQVTLGLTGSALHRRFTGRLLNWEPLPLEPGYGLAELACLPPPETIRDLASRMDGNRRYDMADEVRIRLIWRPPLTIAPLFWPAIATIALGIMGMGLSRVVSTRKRTAGTNTVAAPAVQPRPARDMPVELTTPLLTSPLALDAAAIESGAVGRNLQLLGQRLREAIQRQEVEPELLQAIEWALDRHHVRAVQHLAVGLDHDPHLPLYLERLIARLVNESREHSASSKPPANRLHQRVVRIVQAIAPDMIPASVTSQPSDAGAKSTADTSHNNDTDWTRRKPVAEKLQS